MTPHPEHALIDGRLHVLVELRRGELGPRTFRRESVDADGVRVGWVPVEEVGG